MCDIYYATCEDPGCELQIEMHIGDFAYPRYAVHVRCVDHPPPLDVGGMAPDWEVFVALGPVGKPEQVVFVRVDLLRRPSSDDVCPNYGAPYVTAPVAEH